MNESVELMKSLLQMVKGKFLWYLIGRKGVIAGAERKQGGER